MIKRLRVFLGKIAIAALASVGVKVDDSPGWASLSGGGPADRAWSDVEQDLSDALTAWRLNAWVRQVVRLITAYVVGDGFTVSSTQARVNKFLVRFWEHPQNRMEERMPDWCDEWTRSGELFPALFFNPVDGMPYVRIIPASEIYHVETAENDYERELGYYQRRRMRPGEPKVWKSVHTAKPGEPVMLHYCVNRPVGATRGVSDLLPLLPWARRYTRWLRGRVTRNELRNEMAAVDITVRAGDLEKKQKQYKANPPTRGEVFVHGPDEELKFPAANIEASDASEDGKAIRLAMATAGDCPLHYFGEGADANRATAVAMGDPTHRFYRMRQQSFLWMIVDLCRQAYKGYQLVSGRKVTKGVEVIVGCPDISRADNLSLAQAAKTIVEALATMRDRGWITDELAIRYAFQFAGEFLHEDVIRQILEETHGGDGGDNGTDGEDGGGDRLGAVYDAPAGRGPYETITAVPGAPGGGNGAG